MYATKKKKKIKVLTRSINRALISTLKLCEVKSALYIVFLQRFETNVNVVMGIIHKEAYTMSESIQSVWWHLEKKKFNTRKIQTFVTSFCTILVFKHNYMYNI